MKIAAEAARLANGVQCLSSYRRIAILTEVFLTPFYAKTAISMLRYRKDDIAAVRDVGEGLRIVARSPDGIIEATETTDPDRFLNGVQWHPENLIAESELQKKTASVIH